MALHATDIKERGLLKCRSRILDVFSAFKLGGRLLCILPYTLKYTVFNILYTVDLEQFRLLDMIK